MPVSAVCEKKKEEKRKRRKETVAEITTASSRTHAVAARRPLTQIRRGNKDVRDRSPLEAKKVKHDRISLSCSCIFQGFR